MVVILWYCDRYSVLGDNQDFTVFLSEKQVEGKLLVSIIQIEGKLSVFILISGKGYHEE